MDKINGINLSSLGLSLSDGALESLLTPAGMKEYVSNASPLADGVQYLTDTKLNEREVSLPIHFTAATKAQYLERYAAFCEILAKGVVNLYVDSLGMTFHMLYKSCTSFSHYFGGIARFTLKLIEPDPTNREP